jgi:hypothetical protein
MSLRGTLYLTGTPLLPEKGVSGPGPGYQDYFWSPACPVIPAERAPFDTYMSFIVQLITKSHKQPGMPGTAIDKLIDTLTTPCSR